MRRRLLLLGPAVAAVLAAGAAVLLAGRSEAPAAPGSTLVRTLRDLDGDGRLATGPAEPLLDRTELAPAAPVRRTLATWAQVSDVHLVDEESPLRVEVLDRLGARVAGAFRPQEALSAQVLAAMEPTLDAVAPDLVVLSGDLVDNAQRDELDLLVGVLRGGRVVPDSGRPGYDGLQSATSADPFVYRPDVDAPRHPGLLDAAQEPFTAPGLAAPWLPLVSNHDVLVQGLVPADADLVAIATGARKLAEPSTALLDAARTAYPERATVRSLLADGRAGRFRAVARDAARRPLAPAEATRALAAAAGLEPTGDRLLWARALPGGVTMIGLDTADRAGGADGVLEPAVLRWLEARLAEAAGTRIVVASPTPLEETAGGAEALALLDRTPGVVAVIAGDTHRALVTPRRAAAGGYWLVRAPALADAPQEARAYRLVELVDGRVAIETWLLDHAGREGAGGFLGLAGTSRALAWLDPQGGRPRGALGEPGDRNARLYLP